MRCHLKPHDLQELRVILQLAAEDVEAATEFEFPAGTAKGDLVGLARQAADLSASLSAMVSMLLGKA